MALDFSRCFVIVILLSVVPFIANAQLFGGQIKTNNRGIISGLNCASATNNGTLTEGIPANGVSSDIPYTGGNSGTHNGQTVSSTGVTGLTATLSSGSFANGAGSLTYTITGTPSAAGTANFALNIGGQSCTLTIAVTINLVAQYPAGSVFCSSGPTNIVDVVNPSTGKTWMDRNLGASQVATSINDIAAYGDLYQWGRGSDGHQCRNSATTFTLSTTDQPGNSRFILVSNTPFDWRSPQNNSLWQGVNGINNPCPISYRLPTGAELDAERLSWISNDDAGAFDSPLKLVSAHRRNHSDGSIIFIPAYWSSTVAGVNSIYLYTAGNASLPPGGLRRASGFSVRCIKN